MEKEGEEEDVFEIDDFTVITEFEHFVVAIEALIQEWGLGFLKSCSWQFKSATLSFGESNKLKATYYYPDVVDAVVKDQPNSEADGHLPLFAIDMADAEVDFCYHSNITTMYGVSEYILLSPADQIDDAIMTEDQKNLVISAFRVAQHSVDCEVPMFIQFGHIDRQLFFGTSCNKSVVAHYTGSHLRKGQMRHMHLSGLLDLFKEHVKCPISFLEAEDIRVSIQFDYNIKFPSTASKEIDELCEIVECNSLPFGSRDEPISEFNLIASWPNMKEEMINENEYHSDLDLLSAFNWSGSIDFRYTEGLLGYVLSRIVDLHKSKESSETAFTLLGVRQSPKAFGQLTDGGIQNIRFAGVPNISITNPGGLPLDEVLMPISKSVIKRCMDSIFEAEEDFNEEADASLRQNKWTPPESLTWHFAIAFANASIDDVYGPYAFAQVWLEFVKRLRTYYDSTKDLPGLSNVTQPNLSHCLLHQKIQMLQCCISAKRRRHELYDNTKDFGGDEFFDAQSDQSDESSSSGSREGTEKGTPRNGKLHSEQEPSGRLHPFGEMRLLKHTDTLLYVPITQDRSPMTEDMVDEYANYLSSLDDGEARVQAQLDVLRSDMQAFKAANPKCCLEDFIRWHSPKDWIEEEECLSERMQLPDNTWVKCWSEAMPIPVINQARLFNESKIAEEILSLLENATVQQMVELIRPVLFVAAVVQMIQKGKSVKNYLDKELLINSVCRANRSGSRDDFMEALKHLKAAELFLSQYSSLCSKLRVLKSSGSLIDPPTEEDLFIFVTALIEDASTKRESVERNVISRGVPIFGASNGTLGNAVRIMLEREDVTGGKLPAPTRRQYIIRWTVPRPSAQSRTVPQRLFASIEQDEFRLCGAFAEDTVYM
nr:rab3 GTPase-activating protein catalytic subunit [Haemonchus contortus]